MEEKLTRAEERNAWLQKEVYNLQNEIEAIHQLLDTLPNAVSRRTEAEEEWQRVNRPVIIRLAAWLARK